MPLSDTQEQAMARNLFKHDHNANETDTLMLDSCGACALEGRNAFENDDGQEEPNYAGWALVYVQAGRAIPTRYLSAFRSLRLGSNPSAMRNEAYRNNFLNWLNKVPCPNRTWHHVGSTCAVCGLVD